MECRPLQLGNDPKVESVHWATWERDVIEWATYVVLHGSQKTCTYYKVFLKQRHEHMK